MQLSFTMDFDKFIVIIYMNTHNSKIVQKISRNFYKDETITRSDIKRIFRKIDELPVTREFKTKVEMMMIDILVSERSIQNFPDLFLEMNRVDLQAFLLDRMEKTKQDQMRL